MSFEKFIERSCIIHNFKYDYSKANFVDMDTPILIICPIHGEFWQKPKNHIRGCGCNECGKLKKSEKMRNTREEFIKRAKEKHDNDYIYDEVDYVNADTKVCIICKKHGKFWMTPMNHLLGQKCPKCRGKGLTLEEVIQRCREVHGEDYDYSRIKEFHKMSDKYPIICKEHGVFYQSLSKHILKKQGCPKCGKKHMAEKLRSNLKEVIKKCEERHNFKYDYSKIESINGLNDKVPIICKTHGVFYQRLYDHMRGVGCPYCIHVKSENELEIFNILKEYYDDIESGNKKILNGKELDIFLPSIGFAIEYNGLRWHSDDFGKGKYYHLEKLTKCLEKNIKLIQIFEDEYINHKEIVLSKLKHSLRLDYNLPKIMARKCKVKEIDKQLANNFLEKYHIQGYVPSTAYFGAFYGDILVAVMTFICLDKNAQIWELNRFASNYNYRCQGIGGKLFKHFINECNPNKVKSFADRRWTTNYNDNLYTKLGFEFECFTEPDYQYILSSNPTERIHKFNFRKHLLHKRYGLPLSMTESEMTKELGYSKIWNCGLIKYVWNNKSKI